MCKIGEDLEERKEYFTPNKLEMNPPTPFWRLCLDALGDPTLMVLIFCSFLSLGAGIYESLTVPGHETAWIEGLAIIFTIFIVVMVAATTDYAKEKQFRALSEIANDIKFSVLRNGVDCQISVFDLVVGDILWIKYGDLLPADGLLLEAQQIKCDEAALTGEPILISKDIEEKPFLLSGTKVIYIYIQKLFFFSYLRYSYIYIFFFSIVDGR